MGPPKGRYFDPAPLAEVETFVLTADGVEVRANGAATFDVHNARHPDSKYARNGHLRGTTTA